MRSFVHRSSFIVHRKKSKNFELTNELTKNQLTINQKGSSLFEILIVIFILGFIVIIITNLPNAFRVIGNSKYETIAKEIASKKLESLRSQGYMSLTNGTNNFSDSRVSQLPSGAAAIIVDDCDIEICTNDEEVKKVQVKVSWKDQDKPKDFSITTLISNGGLK